MKKFLNIVFILFLFIGLIGCNDNSIDDNPIDDDPSGEVKNEEIKKYQEAAINKLNNSVKMDEKIEDETINQEINNFYNNKVNYIKSINNIEDAKVLDKKLDEDINKFTNSTLKDLLIKKLNDEIKPIIDSITNEDIKVNVNNYYQEVLKELNSAKSINDLINKYSEIKVKTKIYINEKTASLLIELKNKAISELDKYLEVIIDKIPYEEVKTSLKDFYKKELEILNNTNSINEINECVIKLKDELYEFALNDVKKIAIDYLEDFIITNLNKLANEEMKDSFTTFTNEELEKLRNIEKIEEIKPSLENVIKDATEFLTKFIKNEYKEYMDKLMELQNVSVYDYIPESMKPNYKNNLVNANDINYNFNDFVSISDISKYGFGEQWQMVIDTIDNSNLIISVLKILNTSINAVRASFDIYVENTYNDEVSFNYSQDSFNALVEYKDSILTLSIEMLKEYNIPVLGSFKPKLEMIYNIEDGVRSTYITLGDLFKVKYDVKDNTYKLSTKYNVNIAGKNISKIAYLSIEKKEDNVIGHTYEYSSYENTDLIKACADFYINDEYLSVCGNKSSQIIAFKGYINELYSVEEGILLGYKVREELTIAKVTGTYHTLWFNLYDLKGLNSIKVIKKTEDNPSSKALLMYI